MEVTMQIWGVLIAVLATIAVYRHAKGTSPIKSKVLLVVIILFTWTLTIPAYVIGNLMKEKPNE